MQSVVLTVAAQSFHHDLGLSKLIAKADLAGHLTGRVTFSVQLLAAVTVLHVPLTLIFLAS